MSISKLSAKTFVTQKIFVTHWRGKCLCCVILDSWDYLGIIRWTALNISVGYISRPTYQVTPPREPNFWNFLMSRTDLMDDSNLHRITKCLHLGGRWLDSKFTCLNSIQSAQLHKNVRQKTKLCHLFLICITMFSEINATNRKQNHLPRFLHNFADWIEFKHVIF